MSTKLCHLAFSVLALAALAALAAPPAAAASSFSYTQNGVGSTMVQACNNAVQAIVDHCDSNGTITTDPGGCWPLYDAAGTVIGKVCFCKATASWCLIANPNPLFP